MFVFLYRPAETCLSEIEFSCSSSDGSLCFLAQRESELNGVIARANAALEENNDRRKVGKGQVYGQRAARGGVTVVVGRQVLR